MGAGIAGHIANAGHQVLLLDLPGPADGAPNTISDAARQRLIQSDPPALMHKSAAELITAGNIRDDFGALADADWVVEAVVERLDVKRDLYQRLHETLSPECIVTSNTSTIPISLLVETLPMSFQQRFAITHYFNPVRYMRLLELVRGEHTADSIMQTLAEFNDKELGKGVVICGDTPGFLGNRVGVFALQVGIDTAVNLQLPVESADALMGRPMGIPKTGVFGLYDLIGIDLMADVVRSLRAILPDGDAFHAVGAESSMVNGMISAGLTGNKGAGGFYRRADDGTRLARNLATGNYAPAQAGLPQRALAAADAIARQQEPLADLIAGDDLEAQFCQQVLAKVLGYAASLLGDVTDSPQDIDDAMKLGFNWIRGPFEMIDALGMQATRALLESQKVAVPEVLQGSAPFYQVSKGKADPGAIVIDQPDATVKDQIDEPEAGKSEADEPEADKQKNRLLVRHADGDMQPVSLPRDVVRFHLQRRTLTPLHSNSSASLYAIDNDYRLVEFHSKANALTDESMQIVLAAAENHGRGIMIHNDAQHYSAGVDLNAFLALIDAQDWHGIDAFLARFQQAVAALKYAPVPVVGAPSGLSLGGGFEVLMHCDQLVMHANTVVGLVESGVGLLPAGGGVKETFLRWRLAGNDWSTAAWKAWMNLGYGATASSPQSAERLHYFRAGHDQWVMNRDRLYASSVQALDALADGYEAPAEPRFELAGADILQRMAAFMDEGIERGDFFAHDKTVAMHIASVMCSDNGESQDVDEQAMYQRERTAFVALAKTPQTYARIHSLMNGGGTIRN